VFRVSLSATSRSLHGNWINEPIVIHTQTPDITRRYKRGGENFERM